MCVMQLANQNTVDANVLFYVCLHTHSPLHYTPTLIPTLHTHTHPYTIHTHSPLHYTHTLTPTIYTHTLTPTLHTYTLTPTLKPKGHSCCTRLSACARRIVAGQQMELVSTTVGLHGNQGRGGVRGEHT